MKFLFEFIKILTKKQKYNLFIIQILIIIMSFFELLSVVSIAPFMAVITDQSLIHSNYNINVIYTYFNFSNDNEFLIFLALMVFILFSLSMIVSMYTTWRLLRFSQFVGSEISISLFKHYLNQNWLFHSQNSSNDFSRKIFEEVKRLTGGIIQPLLILNNKIILSTVMLLAIFIYNFWIASISFIIFGSIYLILYLFLRKKLFENSERISSLNKNRYNILGEAFGGIKELIINNKSAVFIKQFVHSNLKFASTHSINLSFAQLPRYAIELIAIGSILILILYLLILNNSNLNTLFTTLSIFALAGYKILPAFQQIFSSLAIIKGNLSAFYSINNELKTSNVVNKNKIFSKNFEFKRNILIKNISFSYQDKPNKAIDDLSIEILKDSKIGFVGKSGSGKSTLIDIISGLIENYEGNIYIDDNKINQSNLLFWRNKISYIPQNIFLFDSTIVENITLENEDKKVNEQKLLKSIQMSLVDEILPSLPHKIYSKVGQGGIQLSGGQRQRIGIARALYQDKEIIIFDEATNSLDLETEKIIINNILKEYKNKTIINVSHRIETLKNFDKIFLFEKSKVVDSGSYNNLNNNLNFKHLLID